MLLTDPVAVCNTAMLQPLKNPPMPSELWIAEAQAKKLGYLHMHARARKRPQYGRETLGTGRRRAAQIKQHSTIGTGEEGRPIGENARSFGRCKHHVPPHHVDWKHDQRGDDVLCHSECELSGVRVSLFYLELSLLSSPRLKHTVPSQRRLDHHARVDDGVD
jgi:hypothetical protein